MFNFLFGLFKFKKKRRQEPNRLPDDYSDFDFVNMTELYYKNPWLTKDENPMGLESLWFDCNNNIEKLVLKRLINKFKYVDQQDAKARTKIVLEKCIDDWLLKPDNTLFIAFKIEEFADGSSIALNFIRARISEISELWKVNNFIGDLHRGKRRFRDGNLRNVVLIDDFVGTGGTAKKRIDDVKKDMLEKNKDLNLFVFSLGGMISGKRKIESCKVKYACTYLIDKGTNIAFPKPINFLARKRILKMEDLLHEGSINLPLNKFSLGYEKSEALYSWNVFNIPNNNYPIFWWNQYKNGSRRKPIFTRSQ
ncbi:hypothetical protein GZ212_13095 [Mangrovimonas sp. CR14]|uniref:phosphoribosyltransferase-like protein n=1 Tax=Mangrovimonas sp. CR14 TaxID=2706120 RepID=UPI00141F598D|nr:hypothetical protein [Mangrovimonas sp. CR14]NIK93093.1 hypothetical protein [Mangrovimonas sp. CR14]